MEDCAAPCVAGAALGRSTAIQVGANLVCTRLLPVGLLVFAGTDQGIDWSVTSAATLMTSAPLLLAFLLFQRHFIASFMRAGIR
jgi:sn-glycerol 3-phosphate transport system permease protein